MGGMVAFEMARQLENRGEEVGVLALVDCFAPDPVPGPADSSLGVFAADLGLTPDAELPAAGGLEEGLARILELGRRTGVLPEDVDPSRIRYLYRLFESNERAIRAYRAGPYAGEISLFLTRESIEEGDSVSGWSALARKVEVFAVPGDHFAVVREPNVRVLAAQLDKILR